jgi:hypothetical protein
MSSHVSLSGSLRDLPLAELLGLLIAARQQGVLEFYGAAPGTVVLDDGAVTLALAAEGPSLQQVIIGSGITSAAGWEQASWQTHDGVGLADALVQAGADEQKLEAVLREQCIGAFFELLLPSDTEFAFIPDGRHPLGTRFHFDSYELLDEATTRVDAWKVIAVAIPSTSLVMRISGELPEPSITIGAADWVVLAQVDGHRSIADVIGALGMSAFAVCGVLYRLLLQGAVEHGTHT